jgi:SAM-dependent methyltransferase
MDEVGGTCPRCFSPLRPAPPCSACGLPFERLGARCIDVLGPAAREQRATEVERFYQRSPFPGYASADDAGTLLDRSRRSSFLVSLDVALGASGRVLDCGCGTAQLAAFLALSAPLRVVFGIDGCRASLACAEGFRSRVALSNLQLVRADLFDLPVRPESFEVVICRGVVHHTPDPDEAILRVGRCVAPGGMLVLGFYETLARLVHRARRGLSRVTGNPIEFLDPVLRRTDLDAEKRRIWIEDQYRHPLEHILPLPRVVDSLRSAGFDWVRTLPPAVVGNGLFHTTPRPSRVGLLGLRLGWALRGLNDPDAGLVCVIARRQGRA